MAVHTVQLGPDLDDDDAVVEAQQSGARPAMTGGEITRPGRNPQARGNAVHEGRLDYVS